MLILAVLFLMATYGFTDLWDNYLSNPLLLIIPLLALVCLLLTRLKMKYIKNLNLKRVIKYDIIYNVNLFVECIFIQGPASSTFRN